MKKAFLWIHKRVGVLTIGLLAIFMVGIGLLLNSYALSEPIPKISFSSQTLSYEENDPGSWRVDKGAEWIGLGKARITFQVDTILKTENPNTDVILVLDISGSMAGEKLERVKKDSIDLLTALLSNKNNQAALITFDTNSELVSGFTNDTNSLIEVISSLEAIGTTNYYQPLVHVDEILKNYSKKEDTECVVLFLTDGYPNEDIPNQIGEYQYLKSEYPWLNIHGVQYEMGEEILEPIKEVSDNQFIADMTTLNNVLFDASVLPIPYDKFILTDWIHNEYFDLKEVSNIQPSFGKVELENDNGVPKVTWDLSGLKSGQSATLTIDIDLKGDSYTGSEINPTNKSSKVVSQIDGDKEDVTTKESPSLKTHYKVIYDGNAPSGCSVGEVPEAKDYAVYETVGKSDAVPICEGYQFKGWEIVTEEVKQLNGDYFQMPEKDVTLRAEWGKMGLSKSVEGEVYIQRGPVLQKIGSGYYDKELWQYKDSITKIVFEGEQTSKEGSTEELTWDISAAKDGSVRGLLVPNSDDPSTYTAYIQGLEGKVIANSDSSYLFGGEYFSSFSKLKVIEDLELLDKSQVTNMSSMFEYCKSLTSLDLSDWDTRQVTDMSRMFSDCESLTSLEGLSSWNTHQVTDMYGMFSDCKALNSLEGLSKWDTSQVTDMSSMFSGCWLLTNLDLSSWNTGQVTRMSSMFRNCKVLTSLDLSGWETSKVTDMDDMFYWCFHLTSVGDLSGWDTSRVKDMSSMFDECYDLTSLDLSGWVPSQVTEMDSMFYHCIALTNLDLSGWDTSQVTNMLSMFDGCEALISLDLSGWDTSRVPDMSYMFRDCNALTSLEGLSSWDTSQVTEMDSMFYGCKVLTSLDLSGWDTSKVTNMDGMFRECSSLTSVGDLSRWDTRQVTDMYFMFDDCSQLTATISILNNSVTSYGGMFRNAATKNNAQITVNYSSESEALVEQMIATKNNANSNVIKADSPYVAHSVTIQGRNDIIATPSGGIMFTQITLTPTQENYMVTSFDMNGRKIEGNTFAMPNEEVVITNVTISEGVLWESSHNPYNNNLDETYEHTFEGAGSLTVTLEYQTESASWDYIYLYDSTQKQYGEYGGKTKTTETIIIPGDYIKILFHTDESGNDYYGFKATVIPNYE